VSPPTLPKVLIATWRSVRVIISLPPEQAVISYCKVLVNDELTHSLSVCLCGRRLVSACDCVCPVLRTRPFRFQATCRKRRVILPIVLCLFYVIVVCFVLHACLIWFYYVNFYLLWFSLYFGVFFCVSSDHYGFVFSNFILLGLFFSVPSQEIDWEERLQNDLHVLCVDSDVNPY